jgi:hypothetical protein
MSAMNKADAMKRMRQIYNALMRAVKDGCIPFGYYGPETCRWATSDEMRRFGLEDRPLVHLDESGQIDCYFTETGATVVPGALLLCEFFSFVLPVYPLYIIVF